MAVLVTGGAGFIGSHLGEKLLSLGESVIGVDNLNDYYDPEIKRENIQNSLQNGAFRFYEGDILDLEWLSQIFEMNAITSIFHFAARAGVRPSISQPRLYYSVNVDGTLNLLEMAKQFNIKKFVFSSTSSLYGNSQKTPFSENDHVDHPISPYAASKKAAELLCHTYHHLYGISIACIRFFTVYGPRQRPDMAISYFTKLILENREIPVFNYGKNLRDYTYIDDIIAGVMNIYRSNFGFDIVNLGESATLSTLDLIGLLERVLQKKARLLLLPQQPGDVDMTMADITKAKTRYGYSPQYSVEHGISHFISWAVPRADSVLKKEAVVLK